MSADWVSSLLAFGNQILSAANVIIGFSLFAYILAHNFRSAVAQAFCALMAFVTVVYLVDIGVANIETPVAVTLWLRLQWFGIAFVPAAYFHFSDALLRTTGATSRLRRVGVVATYLLGAAFFILALSTDLLVDGLNHQEHFAHLLAGPYFWIFALYYVLTSVSGWFNIRRARARCLNSTSRRRMSYLMIAFAAPGIGAFPYLVVPSTATYLSPNMISALNLCANLGIALMTIVIAYIVAYQGVLLPDRVIKHSLIHYLLRGPLVAILVIVVMLAIPKVEPILGLPRDAVLVVAVAGMVVVLQVLINLAKPAIDRLIYRADRDEVTWIQSLDRRLLTSTDLEQLLENTLIAVCDLLRVPSGFILTMQGSALSVQVFCGPKEAAMHFLAKTSLPNLLQALQNSRPEDLIHNQDFVPADGHWLLPLRSRRDGSPLGILGLGGAAQGPSFTEEELGALYGWVVRAELALEDMRLQRQIFALLQGLGSQWDQLQEWRSTPQYVGESTLQRWDATALHSLSLVQAVKDALGHFWGGPKLSQSPLLSLQVVREKLDEYDNVPAKAVRAVLREAIERLRPSGERSMTASEWTVYNILELKFIQGQRIRDIAHRLAMSESDFYRKQRIAIEQVAETLAQMERATVQRSSADKHT